MRSILLIILITGIAVAIADPAPLIDDPDSSSTRLPSVLDVLTSLYYFLTGTEPVDKTIDTVAVDQEMKKVIHYDKENRPNPCGTDEPNWVCCSVDPSQIQLFPFDPTLTHFNVDYCCMLFYRIRIMIHNGTWSLLSVILLNCALRSWVFTIFSLTVDIESPACENFLPAGRVMIEMCCQTLNKKVSRVQ